MELYFARESITTELQKLGIAPLSPLINTAYSIPLVFSPPPRSSPIDIIVLFFLLLPPFLAAPAILGLAESVYKK